jgi:hypothetical protein
MDHPGSAIDRFARQMADPAATQRETLTRILRATAGSAFGIRHGFDRIRDIDGFRRAVPLSGYEDLRPWIEGDPGALTGQAPLAFLSTSASTGKPKRIPYTAAFRDSIRLAHNVYSEALFRDFPVLPLRPGRSPRGVGLYQLTSGAAFERGIPIDSYVSRLFDVALPTDPFFHALPRDIYRIPAAHARLYAMILCAASWDLAAIRATNPTTLLLLARILEERTAELLADLEAGRPRSLPEHAELLAPLCAPRLELARRLARLGRPLRPTDLWPELELLVTWRGGTCDLYAPYLREAFGPVRIRAPIFAASEGVIAIPLRDEHRGGVLALESTFFEFRPLGETGDRTVLADELELGKTYELILTAPTGMFRYLIGDLVEVDGREGACPTITFLARKGRTSSLTGEKLTELQVELAVVGAAEKLGARPLHFVLSPEIAKVPSYVLVLEWSRPPPPIQVAAEFARAVDQRLKELNVEYEAKRSSERLGPIRAREVAPGEFERLQAAGLSGGQAANFKLPHLASAKVHGELRELCR